MKNSFSLIIVLLLLLGCSSHQSIQNNHKYTLRIKGSDSMLLLVQRLADQYMVQHPGTPISADGGGSSVGIEALINGEIDICATSRPLTTDEVQRLARRYGSIGVSMLCAKDALSIVVHPSNPVNTLSIHQTKNIFTGAMTQWRDVGGMDNPITIYRRESNSGTYLYFEEHILLGEEYSKDCRIVPGAKALINSIVNDTAAIGYSTFAYANNVKRLSVNNIAPTPENVRNGTYPISRYLYFYTINQPEGEIKKFVDWVVGQEGQRVVKTNGYIPLYDTE